jgi:ferritin-like metal-binding protein YciE
MTKREQFIQWLGDAHAMEVGIVTTLEKHFADAKGMPRVRAALKKHLAETKRHAKEMEKALAAMGGSHPVMKEGLSKMANLAAGLMTTAAADTIVKNAIADFATEHLEIACYTSLIATATALGETKIAAVCKGILREEVAMARELQAQFKSVNDTYLATLEDDDGDKVAARKKTTTKVGGRSKGKTSNKTRSANSR